MAETKITKRSEDYSRWYTDVIAAAELADYAPVKGCMPLAVPEYFGAMSIGMAHIGPIVNSAQKNPALKASATI